MVNRLARFADLLQEQAAQRAEREGSIKGADPGAMIPLLSPAVPLQGGKNSAVAGVSGNRAQPIDPLRVFEAQRGAFQSLNVFSAVFQGNPISTRHR